MKLLKSILSVFLIFLILLGSTTWSVASHDCRMSGQSKLFFLSQENCCPPANSYLPDHTNHVKFEVPVCCDIELIQHIGQDNVIKRKADNWADFSPAQSIKKIQLFPLLKPITFVFPDQNLRDRYGPTPLAFLQSYRI